jgi:hypothetical protein
MRSSGPENSPLSRRLTGWCGRHRRLGFRAKLGPKREVHFRVRTWLLAYPPIRLLASTEETAMAKAMLTHRSRIGLLLTFADAPEPRNCWLR